ncbi:MULTISPECIES: MarR family winged helix-turn-helix transcriptional regulator [Cohnella]|uniref:MarR family winged helix-turn-helix transcriptional regulator n=1 Tax=Cohnella TaxID=329857 RepID=UPI001592D23A|nr:MULTISPECIES: MarR family transcriptional regulator [Cohnella]MBN2984541.1 MarR family transcriptional regulator [Cohnella algarum]
MTLDDSIGFIINQTGRRLTQLLSLRFAPYDVTTEQWSVLARLNEQEAITQKELAFRVGKDQTNVTRILDQLERKKLVVRTANPEDRRSFLPQITDEGKRLYEELCPIERETVRIATAGLSPGELNELNRLLGQIETNTNNRLRQMNES